MKTTDNSISSFGHTERRRPRLGVSGSVEVLWGKRERSCKLRNINSEGALLSGQFPIQKGDFIRMFFKPGAKAAVLCLKGIVAEVTGTVVFQFRVIFEGIPVRSKAILRDYIIAQMPEGEIRKNL